MNNIIRKMIQYDSIEHFKKKDLYGDNDFNDRFYILYRNYKILLEHYLLKKLSLKEMDERIGGSGLFFVPVNSNDMDIYQLLSTLNLKYIYLRNNLNVDKLSVEDINIIVNLTDDELNTPSDKLISLVNNTYRNVIDLNRGNEDIVHMVCYGLDRKDFWFDSKEIVFGVRQDEYVDNGLGENSEWLENYFNQMKFLGELFKELEVKYSEILGIRVNFIYYDNVSIEKSMSR